MIPQAPYSMLHMYRNNLLFSTQNNWPLERKLERFALYYVLLLMSKYFQYFWKKCIELTIYLQVATFFIYIYSKGIQSTVNLLFFQKNQRTKSFRLIDIRLTYAPVHKHIAIWVILYNDFTSKYWSMVFWRGIQLLFEIFCEKNL